MEATGFRKLFGFYPKAPKRVLGLLGEGFGFGGEGLGPHYKGPGSLGYCIATVIINLVSKSLDPLSNPGPLPLPGSALLYTY